MGELADKLRDAALGRVHVDGLAVGLAYAAADEIERLTAELADARTALAVHSGHRLWVGADTEAIGRALAALLTEEERTDG